jgi:hypothetical protein
MNKCLYEILSFYQQFYDWDEKISLTKKTLLPKLH